MPLVFSISNLGAPVTKRLQAPFIADAAAVQPVKIGMVWAKAGSAADQGKYLSHGGIWVWNSRETTLDYAVSLDELPLSSWRSHEEPVP